MARSVTIDTTTRAVRSVAGVWRSRRARRRSAPGRRPPPRRHAGSRAPPTGAGCAWCVGGALGLAGHRHRSPDRSVDRDRDPEPGRHQLRRRSIDRQPAGLGCHGVAGRRRAPAGPSGAVGAPARSARLGGSGHGRRHGPGAVDAVRSASASAPDAARWARCWSTRDRRPRGRRQAGLADDPHPVGVDRQPEAAAQQPVDRAGDVDLVGARASCSRSVPGPSPAGSTAAAATPGTPSSAATRSPVVADGHGPCRSPRAGALHLAGIDSGRSRCIDPGGRRP